jgi:hypothetical protein
MYFLEFTMPRHKLNASETVMLLEVVEFIIIIEWRGTCKVLEKLSAHIEKGKRGCQYDCVLRISCIESMLLLLFILLPYSIVNVPYSPSNSYQVSRKLYKKLLHDGGFHKAPI